MAAALRGPEDAANQRSLRYALSGQCVWPPDYPNDLNAMHEAWLKLSFVQKLVFADKLRSILECDFGACNYASAFKDLSLSDQLKLLEKATASQRAEALIEGINAF